MNALDGYRSATYDDAVAPDGTHPAATPARSWRRVLAHDLAALGRERARARSRALGIRFASVDGDDNWHVDPVPRVIAARRVGAASRPGSRQRVRALNAFVADVYGERRIVAEGVVPAARARQRGGLRARDARRARRATASGSASPASTSCATATGDWLVLEDNVRTPSGHRLLGRRARRRRCARLDVAGAAPRADRRHRATRCGSVFGPGNAVVLTDGPDNSAYWEHALDRRAARASRSSSPADLEVRGGPPAPRRRRRSTRSTAARTPTRSTRDGGRAAPPGRARRAASSWSTASAPASPTTSSRTPTSRTWSASTSARSRCSSRSRRSTSAIPRTLERALDVFDELVIKDRGSYGGIGVVICPHAERADVEALREQVRAAPGGLRRPAAGRALDPPDRDRRRARARATSTCDRSC